jgi:hypothetical protein
MSPADRAPQGDGVPTDPHWFRDAVIYSCHIRSFADSDGTATATSRG